MFVCRVANGPDRGHGHAPPARRMRQERRDAGVGVGLRVHGGTRAGDRQRKSHAGHARRAKARRAGEARSGQSHARPDLGRQDQREAGRGQTGKRAGSQGHATPIGAHEDRRRPRRDARTEEGGQGQGEHGAEARQPARRHRQTTHARSAAGLGRDPSRSKGCEGGRTTRPGRRHRQSRLRLAGRFRSVLRKVDTAAPVSLVARRG